MFVVRNRHATRSDEADCDDCSSPGCTNTTCTTCKTCHDPDCTSKPCNKEKQPIPYQDRPNTPEEKSTWRCENCRAETDQHAYPCKVCKEQRKSHFMFILRNRNAARSDAPHCDDCSNPPCSNLQCATCKTCRDITCKNKICHKPRSAVHHTLQPSSMAEKSNWLCLTCQNQKKQDAEKGVACIKCETFLHVSEMNQSQKKNLLYRGRVYMCTQCKAKGYDPRNTNEYECTVCKQQGGIQLFDRKNIKMKSQMGTLLCKLCSTNSS